MEDKDKEKEEKKVEEENVESTDGNVATIDEKPKTIKEQLEEMEEKPIGETIDTLNAALQDFKQNLSSKVVESFTELPSCEEIIYVWNYNFLDGEGGGKIFEFKFHAIPRKEFKRIEELLPYPEADKRPAVDPHTKEPIIDEYGKVKMIPMEDDPNYIKQREDTSNKRTISLIEVSLGFGVPGNNHDDKMAWFDSQPLTLWRSMFNIIWGRLIGGGLVNFT